VVLQWIGTTSEGEEAKGSIKITEFSHEVLDGLSEYCVSSPDPAMDRSSSYV
jgi:hypothetical protein